MTKVDKQAVVLKLELARISVVRDGGPDWKNAGRLIREAQALVREARAAAKVAKVRG